MSDTNVIQGDFTVKDEVTVPEVEFHTILEVWREVLKPAATEAKKRPTAGWSAKMVNKFPHITFDQMAEFRDRYYAKIEELTQILLGEINSDTKCLTVPKTEAEDAELNGDHYRNLLRDWQLCVLGWELAWRHDDPYAAVELGAISEVHGVFFGQTGLTQFLDNIQLEYTEADQAELALKLEEFRKAAEGE